MDSIPQNPTQSVEYVGLKGWLIPVGIGVLIMPIRIAYYLLSTYLPIFTDGTWAALTDPTSETFAPFWKPLLLSEIFVNLTLMVAGIYLIVLYFEKKKQFPPWFIGMLLVTLLWIITDAVVVSMVVPGEPVFDSDTLKDVIRSTIGCAIWVPYIVVSKRVKATFVR